MLRKFLLPTLSPLLALALTPKIALSQLASATPAAATAPTAVPALVPYSGIAVATDGKPLSGEVAATFLIYKDEAGGELLFTETQNVLIDAAGHFNAQLGATYPNGLPLDLFATGEARWLEVQLAGQPAQARVLLASVPYALKASDAETLGGLPASAFLKAGQEGRLAAAPTLAPNAVSGVTTTGGTAGYVPVFTAATAIANSPVFIQGANVGIGTTAPTTPLTVNGNTTLNGAMTVTGDSTYYGSLVMPSINTATATNSYASNYIKLQTSAYNSATQTVVEPRFQWQALVTGNNTPNPGATLSLYASAGTAKPTPTGFSFKTDGTVNFAPGQTFPGAGGGSITGVTAGTGLTGGGTTGNVTLNLNTNLVPLLAASNNFSGNQKVVGSVTATSFSGNGAGLTNVSAANAAALGGLSPAAYAVLAANNSFTGVQSFNGNVGIGTASPRSSLELQVPASAGLGPVLTLTNTLGGAGAASALDFNTVQPSNTGTYNPMARIVAQDATHFSDNLLFQSNNPGPHAQNSGLQTNMIITSTGLVGIGTTSPTTPLQVNGTVTATSFVGNGAGLTGVTASTANASTLGGLAPSAFAQVGADNNFTADQSISGNLTASGAVSAGTVNAVTSFNLGGALFAYGSLTSNNVFLGFAGNTSTTGGSNTASGASALASNTTGGGNTATGESALISNTTGYLNTASGVEALYYDTSGFSNAASGFQALYYNTTGDYNTANGVAALVNNTSGSRNVGIGLAAGSTANGDSLVGSGNTAIGSSSEFAKGTFSNATAIGANAVVGQSDTMVLGCIAGTNGCTNSVKVGIGTTAPTSPLQVIGTVAATSFVGDGSGLSGTIKASQLGGLSPSAFAQVGAANTFAASQQINGTVTASSFSGNGVGLANVNASQLGGLPPNYYAQLLNDNNFAGNVTIAGSLTTSATATAITVNAVNGFNLAGTLIAFGSVDNDSVFLGFAGNPQSTNSVGESNTGLGFQALYSNVGTGNGGNTATGSQTLHTNTLGESNTADGVKALYANVNGADNTAAGVEALFSNTSGVYNTADGVAALNSSTTGSYNTASGALTLYSNDTGSSNTAVGFQALATNVTGSGNVAVGSYAGRIADQTQGQGNNNTIIGAGASIATGSISNATAIGAGSTAAESNTLVLGANGVNVGIGTNTPDSLLTVNGSADKPGGGSWGTYSDMRLKTVNGSFGSGLDQVMRIRPIRYRYNPGNGMGIRDMDEHVGVVAQEVQRVIPEAVTENSKGYLLVNNDPILWSMVNAIQEQQREIAAQQKLIRAQSQMVKSLTAEVRETRKTLRQVKELAASGQGTMVASK